MIRLVCWNTFSSFVFTGLALFVNSMHAPSSSICLRSFMNFFWVGEPRSSSMYSWFVKARLSRKLSFSFSISLTLNVCSSVLLPNLVVSGRLLICCWVRNFMLLADWFLCNYWYFPKVFRLILPLSISLSLLRLILLLESLAFLPEFPLILATVCLLLMLWLLTPYILGLFFPPKLICALKYFFLGGELDFLFKNSLFFCFPWF